MQIITLTLAPAYDIHCRCDTFAAQQENLAHILSYDAGFDDGYLRFEGVATVEKLEGEKTFESVSDTAVWELMYFGKSCADEKYKAKQ